MNNRNPRQATYRQKKGPASKQPRKSAVVAELERIILGQRQKVKPSAIRTQQRARKSNGPRNNNPLYQAVTGILSPFSGLRGTVSGLVDPRPSQKFSGRGMISYQIPAGESFLAFVYPCIANGTTLPSMTLNYGTIANMDLATSTYTSATVAATPLNITQIHANTSTPYTYAAVNNGQNNYRLLSAGVRIRWTGANLYRGGLFKYYHDTRGDILQSGDLTSMKFSEIIAILDSHSGTIRHNLADVPELLVNFPSVTAVSQGWSNGTNVWPGNQEFTAQRIGGTTSTYLAGQPIGYIYGVNTTGQSMYFDAEIVEHWEIAGRSVDALNTPSTGSADMANSLSTLVVQAHQHLAHNPSNSYHSALKSMIKDPHVRSAFSGVASTLLSSVVAAL